MNACHVSWSMWPGLPRILLLLIMCAHVDKAVGGLQGETAQIGEFGCGGAVGSCHGLFQHLRTAIGFWQSQGCLPVVIAAGRPFCTGLMEGSGAFRRNEALAECLRGRLKA